MEEEEPSNKADIDDLVKAYKKELKIARSTEIQSLEKEIDKLKRDPLQYRYFLRRYIKTAPSTSKPEAPEVPAAAAPKERYLSLLGPAYGVPTKVPPKGGKSRRRRNKKGKKKTNKRRRN